LNVDAVTRYGSSSSSGADRPKKSARKEAERERRENEAHGPLTTMTSSALEKDAKTDEPDPKLKVPSVLELLKANKSVSSSGSNLTSASYDDDYKEDERDKPFSTLTPSSFFGGGAGEDDSARYPEGFSMGVSTGGVASSPCKMISSTGTKDFVVTHRAAGGGFDCTGALIDR
jgi:hypothetical protein